MTSQQATTEYAQECRKLARDFLEQHDTLAHLHPGLARYALMRAIEHHQEAQRADCLAQKEEYGSE